MKLLPETIEEALKPTVLDRILNLISSWESAIPEQYISYICITPQLERQLYLERDFENKIAVNFKFGNNGCLDQIALNNRYYFMMVSEQMPKDTITIGMTHNGTWAKEEPQRGE